MMTYQDDNDGHLRDADLEQHDIDINLSQSQTPASSKFVSPVVDRSHPRRLESRYTNLELKEMNKNAEH